IPTSSENGKGKPMTLKELEAWHRREAEGLLRSAQAEDRRSACDAVAIKGAKESTVASCSCGSFGINGAMTMQRKTMMPKWGFLLILASLFVRKSSSDANPSAGRFTSRTV